ncbi:MAG: sugar porter family MFS transporter [Rhabdochlamydiaceae bacterium]|nr:sugar porter family MFS transporter [Candidatus Amphrikana amoebophyrae]
MKKKKVQLSNLAIIIAAIGAIGGFLFGYNTAVISGALLIFSDLFNLSLAAKANVVSILIFGALIGAIVSGFLSDKLGRKYTVIFTAIVYVIGSFLLTFTDSFVTLLFGRFITGLGVGLGSLVVPLYLSEMAPVKFRGAMVTANQLMVTIGILVSYIANFYLDTAKIWPWLFIISIIFSLILFVCMFFLPESATWLITKGKKVKAKKILRKVRKGENVDTIIAKVEKNMKKPLKKTSMKKKLMGALVVGVGLSIIQQITGVNAVFYYAPSIFQEVGFVTRSSAMLATIALGAINVIATVVAMWLLDLKGRRPLLLVGVAGMFLGLIFLSICFFIGPSLTAFSLFSLMFYVVFFAIGLGPIAWLIISEIFPLAVRGRVMGICVFVNWASNYVVSLCFLPLTKYVGSAWTFVIFAIITFFSFFFVYFRVPETKGRSLEEIEAFWKK